MRGSYVAVLILLSAVFAGLPQAYSQDAGNFDVVLMITGSQYGFEGRSLYISPSVYIYSEQNVTFNMSLELYINGTLFAEEHFLANVTLNSTMDYNDTIIYFDYYYTPNTTGVYYVYGKLTYNISANETDVLENDFYFVVGERAFNGPINITEGTYQIYRYVGEDTSYTLEVRCVGQINETFVNITLSYSSGSDDYTYWMLLNLSDREAFIKFGDTMSSLGYYLFGVPTSGIRIYDLIPLMDAMGLVIGTENISILNMTRAAYVIIASPNGGQSYEIMYYDSETGIFLKSQGQDYAIELVETNVFNKTEEQESTNQTESEQPTNETTPENETETPTEGEEEQQQTSTLPMDIKFVAVAVIAIVAVSVVALLFMRKRGLSSA